MYYILAKTTVLLQNLRKIQTSRRRLGFLSIVFASVITLVIWVSLTDSANAWGKDIADGVLNLISGVLLLIASLFMKVAIWMLTFVIEIGGYNGYIDSNAVTVGWVMVRDVANMFFVIILLVIAFGTILGLEQYEWKKLLVKFMLAAVLVNFSRVICGVIIDASQVIMMTFINGVAATAGGNLINMFNWNDINTLSEDGMDPGNVFMASVGAIVFAAMGMAVIAIYLIILLARLVVLWTLIVLSPLAFVLSVIPQTQKYAQQWWQKFGGNVIVGPVLAFFLWLSFVTLTANTDGIHSHIAQESKVPKKISTSYDTGDVGKYGKESAGVTRAMTWHNMANFAIAIAMLIVGAKAAQETGAVGGGMMAGAIDFGKKVATIASGVAAGMYLYGGTKNLASGAGKLVEKGGKGALYHMPVVGGKKWALRAKNEWDAVKGWYYGQAILPTGKGKEAQKELAGVEADLGVEDHGKREYLREEKTKREEALKNIKKNEATLKDGEELPVELAQQKSALEGELKSIKTQLGKDGTEAEMAALRKKREELLEVMEENTGKGVIGTIAAHGLALEKTAGKTERQAKTRKDILWKRTGSDSGGRVFMRKNAMRDSQDRIERGWLKVEEARSASKDEEGENLGQYETLSRYRYKDGKYEGSKGTMAERIAQRKVAAEMHKAKMENLEAEARLKLVLDPHAGAPMTGIDGRKVNFNRLVEEQALSKLSKDRLGQEEEGILDDRMAAKMLQASSLNDLAAKAETGLLDDEERQELIANAKKSLDDVSDEINSFVDAKKDVVNQKNKAYQLKSELENEEETASDERKKEIEAEVARIDSHIAKLDRHMTGEEDYKGQNLGNERRSGLEKTKKDAKEELEKAQADAIIQADAIRNGDSETVSELSSRLKKQAVQIEMNSEKKAKEVAVETMHERFKKSKEDHEEKIKSLREKGENGLADEEEEKFKKEAQKKFGRNALKKEIEGLEAKYMKDAQDKRGYAEELEHSLQYMNKGASTAWAYGTSTAKRQEASRGFRYRHNSMLSTAEQLEIWDKRGIQSPDNALAELAEEYEKNFKEISYDAFVATAHETFTSAVEKVNSGGKLTDGDRASLVGLFKRGFDESWVDDIIISIMGNNESKAMIGDALGWTDQDFTSNRIGEVITLAATGDLDFTNQSIVMRELQDEVVSNAEWKMDTSGLYEGLRTGVFKDANGNTLSSDTKGKMKTSIEKHLQSLGRTFTAGQQEMFDKVFSEDASDVSAVKEEVENYLETARKNQPALQFMGNLRNQAITNKHAENSERALSTNIGGGEVVYMPSGARQAASGAYGDLNKTETRMRVGAHPHVTMDLAVTSGGQVSLGLREYEDDVTRNDVTDSRKHTGTTPRYIRVANGFGSAENLSDYRKGEGGSLQIGESKGLQEAVMRDHGHVIQEYIDKGWTEEQAKRFVTSREFTRRTWAKKMKNNIHDFLMTAGGGSGVTTGDAQLKGKMNIEVPGIEADGSFGTRHITEANQLIRIMRGEDKEFSLGYTVSKDQIANFEKSMKDTTKPDPNEI